MAIEREDARGWYEAYGWHLSTEHAGDVELQVVKVDWLDGDDWTALSALSDEQIVDRLVDQLIATFERTRGNRFAEKGEPDDHDGSSG